MDRIGILQEKIAEQERKIDALSREIAEARSYVQRMKNEIKMRKTHLAIAEKLSKHKGASNG